MRVIQGIIAGLAFAGLIGCNAARVRDSVSLITPQPGQVQTKPGTWKTLAQGVERREMDLSAIAGLFSGKMVIVRLDPAAVTFRIHYSPGQPYALSDWRDQLPQAAVILNGGFFDPADHALGLLVSDGVAFGESFAGFGGMFQVADSGTRVRSLVREPYQGELLWQAVQAFPMLIDGGEIVIPQDGGFDKRSRRTWAGQDRSGRIIFGITTGLISFTELQQWLAASDLDLYMAFGLDGGRSTGMVIDTPGHHESYPSFDRLPVVIAIYSP